MTKAGKLVLPLLIQLHKLPFTFRADLSLFAKPTVELTVMEHGERLHPFTFLACYSYQGLNNVLEDCAEMLPSGKQSKFDNRVAWARTYLDKAGLIETPSRGKYRITGDGKKALLSGEEINLKYLEKSEKFREFHSVMAPNVSNLDDEEKDESPMEILDAAFQQITATLASQLMDEVMKLSSTEFENW